MQQIIQWVLSLGNIPEKKKSLPASGSINATLNKSAKDNGLLYLTASFTNKGGSGIKSLTGKKTIVLRNTKITFDRVHRMKGYNKSSFNNDTCLIPPKDEGWFVVDTVDMSGIFAAEL